MKESSWMNERVGKRKKEDDWMYVCIYFEWELQSSVCQQCVCPGSGRDHQVSPSVDSRACGYSDHGTRRNVNHFLPVFYHTPTGLKEPLKEHKPTNTTCRSRFKWLQSDYSMFNFFKTAHLWQKILIRAVRKAWLKLNRSRAWHRGMSMGIS